MALVFEVFWSSFQPPQVVMVPATQTCDWSELQIVSMAIKRICAERTFGLGNELMGTLLGYEPPLQCERVGVRGRRPAEILPLELFSPALSPRPAHPPPVLLLPTPNPPWRTRFPIGSAVALVATEDVNFKFLAIPNKNCRSEKYG